MSMEIDKFCIYTDDDWRCDLASSLTILDSFSHWYQIRINVVSCGYTLRVRTTWLSRLLQSELQSRITSPKCLHGSKYSTLSDIAHIFAA